MVANIAHSLDFISLHSGRAYRNQHKEALATRDAGTFNTMSYSELASAIEVFSEHLSTKFSPEQHVMLLSGSSHLWPLAYFAILRAGGIVVPADPASTDDELRTLAHLTDVEFVVTANETLGERIHRFLDCGHTDVQENHRGTSSYAGVERDSHDIAMIVPTSGTGGVPKAVELSFSNISYIVHSAIDLHSMNAHENWLSVLPLNHMFELSCCLLPCLTTGATMCFPSTLMPHELTEIMKTRSINKMAVVPTLLSIFQKTIVSSMVKLPECFTTFYCGGAAVSDDLVAFFHEYDIDVYPGYGLTETSPTISANSPGQSRISSVGRVIEGTEVFIGDAGEICVRGPGLMRGYYNNPELTQASMVDGWFHTGDIGYIDDGFLYVSGRIKNLIVRDDGRKVQPEEVELALTESSLFEEVCIVGDRNVVAVIVPAASIRGEENLSERIDEEIVHRTASMSSYKRPDHVVIHSDPLPKTVKKTISRVEVYGLVNKDLL